MQKLEGMDAVRDRMPLARLAREIGITRGAVAQWEKVPAERLGDVSRVTGIPFERLRPDLFKAASETVA
ncbi:YdaS family helix-turn-helix protein [Rhizobium ruizarguesonis]|uniref:YdaS family helix-turn-helix protein n=1 Tax=Rhizobium ruizarguesonis TaxID=2081791 RepID=UPI001FDF0364|nr:YdaS family helix-turn-helix protein [Rhizobium ruizarguesonis]